MAIKWVKMHHFGPRFQDMKATGLLFHMVKARIESVHFSALYDNVSIRSFSVLFLSKTCKNMKFFLIFSHFFMIFSDRNMAIKCAKMHRFEPRFHHMKAANLLFHLVKTRFETDNFQAFSGHVPKSFFFFTKFGIKFPKNAKKNIKNVTCHASVTRGYGRPAGRSVGRTQ